MVKTGWRVLVLGGLMLALAATASRADKPRGEAGKPDAAAVERARTTVRMLDDLYKGFVVHITGTYVDSQDKAPAARVAKRVFKHMEDKGWGQARLIDVTGEPVSKANVAKTPFELAAAKKVAAGEGYVEEVAVKDGKPVLRAATIVPVVMKQCSGCHLGRKEGQPIGALVYEVPIR